LGGCDSLLTQFFLAFLQLATYTPEHTTEEFQTVGFQIIRCSEFEVVADGTVGGGESEIYLRALEEPKSMEHKRRDLGYHPFLVN
jgi:hypothetical protein